MIRYHIEQALRDTRQALNLMDFGGNADATTWRVVRSRLYEIEKTLSRAEDELAPVSSEPSS